MDGGEKDQFENEKRNEDSKNYNSGRMSSEWQFCPPNLSNGPLNLVTSSGNPVPFCKEDLMRSSVSMMDSINQAIWEHPNNLQNVGCSDISVQNNLRTLNTLGILKGNPASLRSGDIDRTHDMGWNPRMPMVKGSTLLPNLSETIPESLSQFPVDSGLIERAARFSCFNSGNFTDMLSPFGNTDAIGPYTRVEGLMPGPREVVTGNFVKPVHYMQQHNNELDGSGASRDIPASVKHGTPEVSPQKNEGKDIRLVISQDKEKDCTNQLGNWADEAELSGDVRGSGHDDPSMLETTGGEAPSKTFISKKRRRGDEDAEPDKGKGVAQTSENDKDEEDAQQKVNQTPDCLANKGTGKNNKQGSQASDPPKEEYIHVRARRGQATNSHSLAERVRREKISERMKFLQDLVPGCSKVTGKAVMLDEIINYVQSLQRQVEFLSMKLATVNPRVDFNLEGLLAKDMLQSRAGPSSTLGFLPDMPMAYPPLHIPQPGLIQPGIPGMAGPDLVRRNNSNSLMAPMTGGLKEPTQLPSHWTDELNNVVQMGFSNVTSSSQDVDGSLSQGHMKVEL